jgi:hypothetical protein
MLHPVNDNDENEDFAHRLNELESSVGTTHTLAASEGGQQEMHTLCQSISCAVFCF